MPVYSAYISIHSRGFADVQDITPQVAGILQKSGLQSGMANIFVAGSTAAVTTIEYEPGVVQDLKDAIERLIPQNIPYRHDAAWGDGNGFAHVRAALIGASFTVPFTNRRLELGAWQQIVALDFDNRPRQREIRVQLVGE